MRRTTLLATVLLALGMTACGNTNSTHSHTASAGAHDPHGYLNDGDFDFPGDPDYDDYNDNDNDRSEDYKPSERHYYHDRDDNGMVDYGHAAAPAEARAVTAIVERYYALAAGGDGAKACAMLGASFAASVAEDYGRESAGPAYLRNGTSCTQVLDLLFAHERAKLTSLPAVTGVRVEGDQAIALLGSAIAEASYLPLTRERDGWKVDSLLGAVIG
jgi:hypothetical protein